ncbi:MAG: amidohydrolase family protein [Kiritimatiellia bacterium]
MKAIINTKLVLEENIILDGVLLHDGGRIVACGGARSLAVPAGTAVTDARGLYTIPGFIDIHNHGSGEHRMYRNPESVCTRYLDHGTTTALACCSYGQNFDSFLAGIRTIRAAAGKGDCRIIQGLYLEGPYMNVKYGAGARDNPWGAPVNAREYKPLADAAGDFARIWCVAPEREGVEEFMQYARQVNPGVLFAMGHSEAHPDQAKKLKKYGLKVQTHHTNATGIVLTNGSSGKGIRDVGPDEAVWYDDDIYAELISDELGIHVRPHMQRLAAKIKGINRIILITDSTDSVESGGQAPEALRHARDINFDKYGAVSGSKLSMDVACRNFMSHTGYGIGHIARMASLNAARLLGIDGELGSIAEGKKANLLICDDTFNIDRVIFEGETVRG